MSPLRRVPPVHASIRIGALWRAALAHLGPTRRAAAHAIARATARLSVVYPDREIVLTDSGTSALMLALQATIPPAGATARVALPAYACPDIGTAALGAGYQIVLYDVEPTTLAPNLASMRRCLDAGATHVVAVHLFGRLVDVAEVMRLAAPYGAVVIEDAAQHAGGTLRGVRGGALADWSVLSFGRGKGINAGGGGALMRRHDGAAPLPVVLPESGMTASLIALLKAAATAVLSHSAVYWLPAAIPALRLGATEYHAPTPAQTITMSSALLLTEALDREPQALAARRMAEQEYSDALVALACGGIPVMLAPSCSVMVTGALRVPARLPAAAAAALSPLGVVRSYPRTLADYPAIAESLVNPGEPITGARGLADALYTLPTHARLRFRQRNAIIRGLQAILGTPTRPVD